MASVRARSRLSGVALGLLLCGVFSGCLGGQTGAEIKGGDCTAPDLELAWDQQTPLQLLPEEARALVVGKHVAALTWFDTSEAYSFEPEHGESQIVIDVASPVALPKLIRSESCESYLSFQSTVTVSTAGGALLEEFQGTFTANKRDIVRLNARLPLNDLTGSLTVSSQNGKLLTWLQVQAAFRREQPINGELSALASDSSSWGAFACWPSGDECGLPF